MPTEGALPEAMPPETVGVEALTGERVRILPTDPRDMARFAVRWAHSVHAAIHPIPRTQ